MAGFAILTIIIHQLLQTNCSVTFQLLWIAMSHRSKMHNGVVLVKGLIRIFTFTAFRNGTQTLV